MKRSCNSCGSGRDDARQDPFGDAHRRPYQTGAFAELLIHDELLAHAGVAAPRCGPVRRDQSRVGQQLTSRPDGELRIFALAPEAVVGQVECAVKNVADPRPEISVGLAQVHRRLAGGGCRQLAEVAGPSRDRADRGGQAGGPAPVQVQVVFPGEADGAEHGERFEHQAGSRHHGHDRGRTRRQPVLVGIRRTGEGPRRIPGRGRGQRAVHQQHRRLVLQRLEGTDRLAELFPRTEMLGDGLHAPLGDARGDRGGERDGHGGDSVRIQSGQGRRERHRVIAQSQDAQIGGEVGATTRFDLSVSRIHHGPEQATGLVGEGNHGALRRTHTERHT